MKRMKNKIKILLILLAVLIMPACEKTITLKLKGVEPRVVIDATLTNTEGEGACLVSMHKTIDYFAENTFVPIENAMILLSDNKGNTEMLYEYEPGKYSSTVMSGEPGTTYTLEVTAEGKSYSAVSIMRPHVEIDSLTYRYNDILWGPYDDEGYLLDCHISDANEDNYIALFVKKNGKRCDEIYFLNGLFGFQIEDVFQLEDEAEVELRNLTEEMYHYYSTINKISGADGNPLSGGGTPINPVSNISNGALGCFAVYPISVKNITIME